jgi:hypothetical protein
MECSLERGDLLRLEGGRQGTLLHCLKGTLWLTKGDGRDYLVHGGGSLRLEAGAAAVVEALRPAELRMEAAGRPAADSRSVLTLAACRA